MVLAQSQMLDQWNRTESLVISFYDQLIWTRIPRPFNGERIVFAKNGIEITRQPHIKETVWTLTSHYLQKLIQNGSMS